MAKLTKRFRAAQEAADLSKEYTVAEAVDALAKLPKANFDETVELSMKLLVDPRKGDEMVRGTVMLPHGSGKTVRVLAFTTDPMRLLLLARLLRVSEISSRRSKVDGSISM